MHIYTEISIVLFQDEGGESVSSPKRHPGDEARTSLLNKDAFLVFRALCKLSIRTSDSATVQDPTAVRCAQWSSCRRCSTLRCAYPASCKHADVCTLSIRMLDSLKIGSCRISSGLRCCEGRQAGRMFCMLCKHTCAGEVIIPHVSWQSCTVLAFKEYP